MKPRYKVSTTETVPQCRRCGNEFDPDESLLLGKPSRFCSTCQCRNLFDGLGMATPPAMLDKFTKRPTLTNEEYQQTLQPKRRKKKP